MQMNVRTKINDYESIVIGTLDNNVLSYQDDSNEMIIDIKKHSLERQNNDYKIALDFGNNKGYIYIDKKERLDLDLKTNIMIFKQGYIQIEYVLNNNQFKYIIEYEDINEELSNKIN